MVSRRFLKFFSVFLVSRLSKVFPCFYRLLLKILFVVWWRWQEFWRRFLFKKYPSDPTPDLQRDPFTPSLFPLLHLPSFMRIVTNTRSKSCKYLFSFIKTMRMLNYWPIYSYELGTTWEWFVAFILLPRSIIFVTTFWFLIRNFCKVYDFGLHFSKTTKLRSKYQY